MNTKEMALRGSREGHAASKRPEKDISMVLHMEQTVMSGLPGLLGDRPSGTWFFEEELRVWAQFQILLHTHYVYVSPHFPVTSWENSENISC